MFKTRLKLVDQELQTMPTDKEICSSQYIATILYGFFYRLHQWRISHANIQAFAHKQRNHVTSPILKFYQNNIHMSKLFLSQWISLSY